MLRTSQYVTWEEFVAQAKKYWSVYSHWFSIAEPHGIFVRFINRIELSPAHSKAADCFHDFPEAPPDTDWNLSGLLNRRIFSPIDDRFQITYSFSEIQAPVDRVRVFLLDTTVEPLFPFAKSGESMESLLPAMRGLKNQTFFGLLKENILCSYL